MFKNFTSTKIIITLKLSYDYYLATLLMLCFFYFCIKLLIIRSILWVNKFLFKLKFCDTPTERTVILSTTNVGHHCGVSSHAVGNRDFHAIGNQVSGQILWGAIRSNSYREDDVCYELLFQVIVIGRWYHNIISLRLIVASHLSFSFSEIFLQDQGRVCMVWRKLSFIKFSIFCDKKKSFVPSQPPSPARLG